MLFKKNKFNDCSFSESLERSQIGIIQVGVVLHSIMFDLFILIKADVGHVNCCSCLFDIRLNLLLAEECVLYSVL